MAELLAHLCVLIPVLDNDKRYWVGEDEVDKLVCHGGMWLANHPERDFITRRYLKHKPSLSGLALAQLSEGDQPNEVAEGAEHTDAGSAEQELERPVRLHDISMATVVRALCECGAKLVRPPTDWHRA